MLVLSDTYYPGWKASWMEVPKKIYQANYAFRAIPLSAGIHQVRFVYDPMSFKLGAGVTFVGILVCLGMGWSWATQEKRLIGHSIHLIECGDPFQNFS